MVMVIVSAVPLVIGVKIVAPVPGLMGCTRPLYVQAMVHVWQSMPVILTLVFAANAPRMVLNHFRHGQEKHVLA